MPESKPDKQLNQQTRNRNIFLLIEQYLTTPSKKLAAQIKQLSHDLTNQAYENAKEKYPSKIQKNSEGKPILDSKGNTKPAIGADEYGPILLDLIQTQAEEAMSNSTRMVKNEGYNEEEDKEDKPYIFKVRQAQQQMIHKLIGDLLAPKDKEALHPDGLIFAFDGYIERRSTSKFKCIEGIEATAYDHNAKLHLKARELSNRGEHEVAGAVTKACEQIKFELMSFKATEQKLSAIKDVLVGLKENPKVQEHRGSLKTIITNFLIIASGVGAIYLAATAKERNSFFYRPATDTKNKALDFENDLNKEGPKKN